MLILRNVFVATVVVITIVIISIILSIISKSSSSKAVATVRIFVSCMGTCRDDAVRDTGNDKVSLA